jgi:hypothetical protein
MKDCITPFLRLPRHQPGSSPWRTFSEQGLRHHRLCGRYRPLEAAGETVRRQTQRDRVRHVARRGIEYRSGDGKRDRHGKKHRPGEGKVVKTERGTERSRERRTENRLAGWRAIEVSVGQLHSDILAPAPHIDEIIGSTLLPAQVLATHSHSVFLSGEQCGGTASCGAIFVALISRTLNLVGCACTGP